MAPVDPRRGALGSAVEPRKFGDRRPLALVGVRLREEVGLSLGVVVVEDPGLTGCPSKGPAWVAARRHHVSTERFR